MKELLSFVKDYGINPLVNFVGMSVIILFTLTLIPALNYLPKAFLLYILTPYVFGK